MSEIWLRYPIWHQRNLLSDSTSISAYLFVQFIPVSRASFPTSHFLWTDSSEVRMTLSVLGLGSPLTLPPLSGPFWNTFTVTGQKGCRIQLPEMSGGGGDCLDCNSYLSNSSPSGPFRSNWEFTHVPQKQGVLSVLYFLWHMASGYSLLQRVHWKFIGTPEAIVKQSPSHDPSPPILPSCSPHCMLPITVSEDKNLPDWGRKR